MRQIYAPSVARRRRLKRRPAAERRGRRLPGSMDSKEGGNLLSDGTDSWERKDRRRKRKRKTKEDEAKDEDKNEGDEEMRT